MREEIKYIWQPISGLLGDTLMLSPVNEQVIWLLELMQRCGHLNGRPAWKSIRVPNPPIELTG